MLTVVGGGGGKTIVKCFTDEIYIYIYIHYGDDVKMTHPSPPPHGHYIE